MISTTSSNGLIRPHSCKLAMLHRFMDGAIIVSALNIGSRLLGIQLHEDYALAAAWAVTFFLLFAEAGGIYNSWRLDPVRREALQVLLTWLSAVGVLVVLAFLMEASAILSRSVVMAWVLITPLLMVALRILARFWLRALRKHGRNTRTLAFAGAGALAQKIFASVESAPWMGLKVVGEFDDRAPDRLFHGHLPEDGPALVGGFSRLVEDARAGKVDYVYITLPMLAEKRIIKLVGDLADTTASVYVVPDFFVFELQHARWFNMDGIPMVSVFESPFYGVDGWLKRAEDLLLGSLILLLISPLMLLIAEGVKLTSPGPAIFKQRRYGLNGEVVEVWKFRSMTVCEDGARVQQARKGDARITPFGAFLRRTSLDELPQFINVLQGTMSVVGPRPHAIAHNEQYRVLIHGYMLRHKVKPGITDWAQVNGWRGETDTLEKMQKRVEYDLAYIRDWSLWGDIKIVWMTLWKGFVGKNAY